MAPATCQVSSDAGVAGPVHSIPRFTHRTPVAQPIQLGIVTHKKHPLLVAKMVSNPSNTMKANGPPPKRLNLKLFLGFLWVFGDGGVGWDPAAPLHMVLTVGFRCAEPGHSMPPVLLQISVDTLGVLTATALCEPRSADFVAGTALCEPRSADFVAGTALCEPRNADFVAGTTLCEPRRADFVAGTTFCEPRSADFVAGTALCEPRRVDFVAGTTLCEPRSADFVAGTALCEPRSADFVAGI